MNLFSSVKVPKFVYSSENLLSKSRFNIYNAIFCAYATLGFSVTTTPSPMIWPTSMIIKNFCQTKINIFLEENENR